jgi:hypothetical protein
VCGCQDATAGLVLEQLVDNALVGAGLMDDSRAMVGRVNALLLALLAAKEAQQAPFEK